MLSGLWHQTHLSEQFSISEIAEMCGYAEPCHFSREFSKRIGTSPKGYITESRK